MSEQENDITFYGVLAGVLICVVLLLTYTILGSEAYDDRGTFGDMFGAANSLFTGLSVVGLLVTILLQRKDINIQREELNKQNNTTQIQNFENTFFQMMNIFYKVIEEIHYSNGTSNYTGRASISSIHYALLKAAQVYHSEKEELIGVDYTVRYFTFTGAEIRTLISEHFVKHKNQLSHYFRTLFNIVEVIDSNQFINKQLYINILTSQLSRTELMLMLYFGIYSENPKYKMYIEKYSLLKDLDRESLIYPSMTGAYNASAFSENTL